MRRWAWAVGLVVLVACGGAEAKNTATSSGPNPSLEAAVRAYSAAYLGGDASAATALLSARCRNRLGTDMPTLVSGATALYGGATMTSYQQNRLSGDRAWVTYDFDVSAINQTGQPWVREAGHWLDDNC